MKLIRQTVLWNNEGFADKVYEIDLCEIGPDKYVVNFRYGRRGSTLKDGTKTAMPVALAQAEAIFNKLADEKRRGGYRDTDNYNANSDINTSTIAAAPSPLENNDLGAFVLRSLREASQPGNIPSKKWPLDRIVWRAGQLRINEAAALIISRLTKGDAIAQYTACWSLGRIGNNMAIAPLEQLIQAKATAVFVKRIALAALIELKKANDTLEPLVQSIFQSLPADTRELLNNGDTAALQAHLHVLALSPEQLHHIDSIYLISEQIPGADQALYNWIKSSAVHPNYFKVFRHLFKLAEFREDAAIFSLLAYKFESAPALFEYGRWQRNSWVYYNGKSYQKPIDEQKKERSALAFSGTTRRYFLRRIWRTLRTLGKQNDESYIRFAFGILLEYNAGIAGSKEPTSVTKTLYQYNYQTRQYSSREVHTLYSAYADSLLLNHILYSGGNRYILKPNRKAWQLQNEAAANSQQREEAFATLWDQFPQALAQLLFDSEQEVVHVFAAKALLSRNDLADIFDIDSLKKLLQQPFAITAKLALLLAEKMYNVQQPDEELITLLLLHPVAEARQLALKWIDARRDYFLQQTDIIVHLVASPYTAVTDIANSWLQNATYGDAWRKLLVDKIILHLLQLPATMPQAEPSATNAATVLLNHYTDILSNLNISWLQELITSPIIALQILGANIALQHSIAVEHLPAGMLSGMIQSSTPKLREAGITLFGRLPEQQLMANASLVAAFCVSPYVEVRTAIQPAIKRLNDQSNQFGLQLLNDLLPYLHRKESSEGLHQTLYNLFTTALQQHLITIDPVTVLSFTHSRFAVPQLLGLYILQHTNKATGLTIRQWVRFASHEVAEIRQLSWHLFEQNTGRMKQEAIEALRILDSSWDDSRQFAFNYFRQHFTETDWTAELLVSVCDSTREDVQAFGREMITRYFKEENGELYLMQLSQHPAQQVQHFTTHYLEQFAGDKPINIAQLEAYFVTVLSQVNKAGVAKKRIFSFLREEALKNAQVAEIAARILARQSATMAVADKAACIAIMHDLTKQYPELNMPLQVLQTKQWEKA